MSDETSPLLKPDLGQSTGYSATQSPGSGSSELESTSSREGASSPAAEEVIVDANGAPIRMVKIVIPLAIGIFLAAMDGTIVASSYASIGSEMKQLQNTSWIATGYMLTLCSFQPLYGKLSDIFGRKACLLFAYSVFAIGCLFCGLSRNMTELIAARALAGLGGGGMTTVVSILVSDLVPLRSRGIWQGVLNIIFATGSATGAPLGGLLADGIGWRWAFLIQVPATLLAIFIVSSTLHLPTKHTSDLRSKLRRIDFSGALLLVLAVFTLLLALDRGGNITWSDRTTIIYIIASAAFFGLFAVTEASFASEPFAPSRIIANLSLLACYLCNFFSMISGMMCIYQFSLYVQAVEGRSAAQAGVALLPSVLGGVLGSLGGGLLMQKTGKYYWLTAAAYCAHFVGTVMVALLTGTVIQTLIGAAGAMFIMSVGNGIGTTSTLVALIANAAPEDQAIATAVSYLFRSLGSVIGISVGSTLVQNTLRLHLRKRLSGKDVDELVSRVRESLSSIDALEPTTREIVRGSYGEALQTAFWFAGAMAGSAALCSFFIREKPLTQRR